MVASGAWIYLFPDSWFLIPDSDYESWELVPITIPIHTKTSPALVKFVLLLVCPYSRQGRYPALSTFVQFGRFLGHPVIRKRCRIEQSSSTMIEEKRLLTASTMSSIAYPRSRRSSANKWSWPSSSTVQACVKSTFMKHEIQAFKWDNLMVYVPNNTVRHCQPDIYHLQHPSRSLGDPP